VLAVALSSHEAFANTSQKALLVLLSLYMYGTRATSDHEAAACAASPVTWNAFRLCGVRRSSSWMLHDTCIS